MRSCVSTTRKTLELSVVLEDSTIFMGLLEHGKVCSFCKLKFTSMDVLSSSMLY